MDQKKPWPQIKIMGTAELLCTHKGVPFIKTDITGGGREGDFGCCWRSKFGINRRIHSWEQEFHGLTGVGNLQIYRLAGTAARPPLTSGAPACWWVQPLATMAFCSSIMLGVCGIAGTGVRRGSFISYIVSMLVSSWATFMKSAI